MQQFAVSGSGLSADITATAPAGFEISTSAGGSYSNTLILKQTAGLVSNTPIYVRSAASAAAGPIKGDVVLHTTGLANKNIPVAGNVAQLPTVNEVANQSVFNGNATTSVTFTGTGNTFSWVNSTPGIGLPASGTGNIPLFTAVNNTANPVKATVTVTPLPAPAYGYVANINANNVSVINLATNATVATIPVGIQPTGVAVSPDGKRVYVTNQSLIGPVNPSTVSVIDVASNTVITNITVGYRPFGIAISADGSRLYVTNQSPSNSVSIINTANNTVIQTIPTIGENPQSVAVSPDGTRLYVTNNSNSYISVINTATTAVLTWIQGGAGPMGIAVSPDNSRIYVANSSSNTVSVIDAVTNQVLYEIPVENQPTGLTISPAGDRTYVSNSLSGTVSVIDNNEHRVIATITAGMAPRGVSLNADGTKLYVSNQASNNVSVINTLDNSVLTSINAGDGAYSFGSFVTPATTCTGKPVTFTITVNPTANITATVPLQQLNTSYGTPSASASFTVSGTNLSAGILVTPPVGFELSTDNITFTNTVTVGTAGSLNAVPVYIRLKSTTNAGGYAGNIVLSSAGAPATNVQMPNSMVTPAPLTIQANNASKVYGAILNSNIISAAFTVLGNGLKNGNTITTINLFFDGGTAAADHVGIYETIMPTVTTGANGFLPGNYTITYIPGALSITPAPLTITATDVSKPYGTALTGLTASVAFTSNGLQNQENIGSVAVAYGNGSGVNDALGFYPGTITPSLAGGGTFDPGNYLITYKTGSITVTPPTGIMVSGTLNALNTIYGTPSVSASFNVSGTGLSGGILITPPPGFEVGTNNSTFGTSVIIGQAGDVAATTVFIRLAAITPAGTYSGNISLSSGTATANEVMPASTVIATPLTIIANNKTKVAGTANPALTVIYTGFVNNESAAQLVIKPVVSTTANTLSAAGQYPITASGAASPNYIISYVDGVLTINPLPPLVTIPNAFTPNGDGTNDVWVIASLAYYPNNTVSIYNRYGQQLYHSAGYAKPWDGTYNGTRVPEAVYYYIIQLDKNQPALSGHVTVIR